MRVKKTVSAKKTAEFPGLPRQIIALALPALGALIAEPLFLLADTAIIGHLGVGELAGAGLGTTILQTAVGLMIFLAYATTPAVARAYGARDMPKALAAGRDGMWLGLFLGIVLAILGYVSAPWLTGLFGPDETTQAFAIDYVRWSMPGVPAMLLVLAATGVLRGLQDGKTPLIVASAGFGLNIVLNFSLVYLAGMSVAGAALGTSIAQWIMAAVYLVLLVPRIREGGVSLAPSRAGLRASAQAGGWLMIRTAAMRIALLLTVWAATAQGAVTLAAHQLAFTFFSTLAFALDAIAIAAQSLIGKELGAGNKDRAQALTTTMVRWGFWFGAVVGALLAATAVWLPRAFTPSSEVAHAATIALLILAVMQPVAGIVFVLDGVLIGAGDHRYLAIASCIQLAVYVPFLAVAALVPLPGLVLAWIWVAFGIYMAARWVTLEMRQRSGAWLVE